MLSIQNKIYCLIVRFKFTIISVDFSNLKHGHFSWVQLFSFYLDFLVKKMSTIFKTVSKSIRSRIPEFTRGHATFSREQSKKMKRQSKQNIQSHFIFTSEIFGKISLIQNHEIDSIFTQHLADVRTQFGIEQWLKLWKKKKRNIFVDEFTFNFRIYCWRNILHIIWLSDVFLIVNQMLFSRLSRLRNKSQNHPILSSFAYKSFIRKAFSPPFIWYILCVNFFKIFVLQIILFLA